MPVAAASPRLVDPVLLDAIASTLDGHEIAYDSLQEGRPHLNACVTDRRRVFVKVSRAGEASRAGIETAAAVWAVDHGVDALVPLLPEPLVLVDADGLHRFVTAWPWLEACSGPALLDRCRDALGALAVIAATPAPHDATDFPLDMYLDRVRRRLAGRRDTLAVATLEAAIAAHATVARLLPTRHHGWSHGDLHLGNLAWRVNGRVVVLDWESSCLAPIEVDLAQVLRSVVVYATDHASDDRDRVARDVAALADDRFDVNWELVAALARFRSASNASHLLVHGHDPAVLRADLAFLEQPVTWTPRPGSVPVAA